ncbi:MAG TPA: neutral zinc metallopeptidase [Longimicrobiales bacterium]
MRWRGYRQSGNVSDRRGMGGIGLAGGGIGAVVIALVAMLFGVNPGDVLQRDQPAEQQANVPAGNDTLVQFVSTVLASTEDVWTDIFSQSNAQYTKPELVLFSGAIQSACGFAQSAVGPFYCSSDQKVYLDLSFFNELRDRFGAAGDFAEAYVIAHEVGHHVQDITGALAHGGGNQASVRQELQADCLAGVWGYYAREKQQLLEPGDMEEALNAASSIGDDRIQKQTQGHVVPESFTHGSSAQRVESFRRGFESGDPKACGL